MNVPDRQVAKNVAFDPKLKAQILLRRLMQRDPIAEAKQERPMENQKQRAKTSQPYQPTAPPFSSGGTKLTCLIHEGRTLFSPSQRANAVARENVIGTSNRFLAGQQSTAKSKLAQPASDGSHFESASVSVVRRETLMGCKGILVAAMSIHSRAKRIANSKKR
jgi:hypothetical protein